MRCDPAEAQVIAMKDKLRLLLEDGVPIKHLAEVFSVDAENLENKVLGKNGQINMEALRELLADAMHEIEFGTCGCCAFELESFSKAELNLQLMCQAPGQNVKSLGTFTYKVSDLLKEPNCTWRMTAKLTDGQGVLLKIKLAA